MIKIAFHVLYEFHTAMLQPIYHELNNEFTCLISSSVKEIIDFSPEIIFIADAHAEQFRQALPRSIIIWTRHGFGSKNHMARSLLACDIACISSEWVKAECLNRNLLPRLGFWLTGFVPMDNVFNGIPLKQTTRWPSSLPASNPTLLYAPTYNKSLSAETVLYQSNWLTQAKQLLPNLNIIIKPHPVIAEREPQWMAQWRKCAEQLPQVYLVENTHDSIFDYYTSVDILLSDASSAFLYFIACNKPIVLISNPAAKRDEVFYDSQGPEWLWRDCAYDIDDVAQLPQKMLYALQNPQELEALRLKYKDYIFGDLVTGDAAQRTANYVRELVAFNHNSLFNFDSLLSIQQNRNINAQENDILKQQNKSLSHTLALYKNRRSIKITDRIAKVTSLFGKYFSNVK